MLSALPALSSQPFPSVLIAAKLRPRRKREFVPLSFVGAREKNWPSQLGFYILDSKARGWSGFVRRCRDWNGDESDFALEAEILEFMRNSEKPEAFPSKRELVDGGRMDLVDAIRKKRGWLSFGWDLDDDDDEEEIVREINDYVTFEETGDWSSGEESQRASFCPYDVEYSNSASSSGRSLDTETRENETGIEGILSRLEKERNVAFGFRAGDIEDNTLSGNNRDGNEDWDSKFSTGEKSDSWRDWSIQRAGVSDVESIVASSETSMGGSKYGGKDGTQRTETADEPRESDELDLQKYEVNHNQIRNRLRRLELELSTVLQAVRSNPDKVILQKDHESSTDAIQMLTDAWEFQQNEITNTQDKLRSTRAKIAVLEGKMALALIDAQKIMEQKQKRIDNTRRGLRLLRSTCIVWPNPASDVLLAGSFDNWGSKRKMEKSRTGIFSLWLQLYPGKYEIKFIVDGEWRIDPLRPTVYNNGYKNNLLIIT